MWSEHELPGIDFAVFLIEDVKKAFVTAAHPMKVVETLDNVFTYIHKNRLHSDSFAKLDVIEIVLELWRRYLRTSIEVCRASLEVCATIMKSDVQNLSTVSDYNIEIVTALGRRGCCDLTVQCLAQYGIKSEMICEYACRVISRLAIDDRNKTKLGRLLSCNYVIRSLDLHVDSQKVALWACAALGSLTTNNLDNVLKVGKLSGNQLLVKVLRDYSTDEEIIAEIAYLMGNLGLNEDNSADLGKHGACHDLVEAFKMFMINPTLAANCCYAVGILSSLVRTHTDNQLVLIRLKTYEALTRCLDIHSSHPVVARWAGAAIRALSNNNPECRTKFGLSNCCQIITSTLIVHMSNWIVVTELCGAVVSLTCDNDNNAISFSRFNIGAVLVEALQVHINDTDTTTEILSAIKQVTQNTCDNRSLVGRVTHNLNGCNALCKAVNLHMQSVDVVMAAVSCMHNIALNPDNAKKIAKFNGCETLMQVFETHEGHSEITRRCCLCVHAVVFRSNSNRSKLKPCCLILLRVLFNFQHDVKMLRDAIKALGVLLHNNQENKLEIVRCQGYHIIIDTIMRNVSNAEIMKYAMPTLAQLSSNLPLPPIWVPRDNESKCNHVIDSTISPTIRPVYASFLAGRSNSRMNVVNSQLAAPFETTLSTVSSKACSSSSSSSSSSDVTTIKRRQVLSPSEHMDVGDLCELLCHVLGHQLDHPGVCEEGCKALRFMLHHGGRNYTNTNGHNYSNTKTKHTISNSDSKTDTITNSKTNSDTSTGDSLTQRHETNSTLQSICGEVDACKLVLTLLHRHGDVVKVAVSGCKLLSALCTGHEMNKKRVADEDAAQLLNQLLLQHNIHTSNFIVHTKGPNNSIKHGSNGITHSSDAIKYGISGSRGQVYNSYNQQQQVDSDHDSTSMTSCLSESQQSIESIEQASRKSTRSLSSKGFSQQKPQLMSFSSVYERSKYLDAVLPAGKEVVTVTNSRGLPPASFVVSQSMHTLQCRSGRHGGEDDLLVDPDDLLHRAVEEAFMCIRRW